MPSLFVIQGADQGKRFDLDRICTTVGRDTVNHIRLNDNETSRQHAEVRQDDLGDGYYVTDLGSSNGTYVNGQLIERHILQSGDRVQFGGTLLIYTGPDAGQDARSLVASVDIVAEDGHESQIISSFPHDENSQFFYGDATDQESPWLARARSNLQVMYRTALAVSHTLDIDELLGRIMELIFEWVEADRGCILLKDRLTDELIPRAHQTRRWTGDKDRRKTDDRRKLQGKKAEGGRRETAERREGPEKLEISQTILDYVLAKSEGVLTSDAREDDRFDEAGSIVKSGVREAIGVPMQGRYGVVGVIYIDTYTPPGELLEGRSKKFSEEHLKMMIAIAHQAALAVEDTAYYSAMLRSERLAAMGQTIAGLSHHVKNILQGIRGGSYLIEEGLKESETDLVRQGWGIVDKNQEKISRLVLDMLTFSKEREPEVENADLRDVVRDVVELTESRASECGVRLEVEHDESLPILRFDSEGIHHALLNVVSNAIDACVDGYQSRLEIDSASAVLRDDELDSDSSSSEDSESEAEESAESDWTEDVFERPADPFGALKEEVERSASESAQSLTQFQRNRDKDSSDDEHEWFKDAISDESESEEQDERDSDVEKGEDESGEEGQNDNDSEESSSEEAEKEQDESDTAETSDDEANDVDSVSASEAETSNELGISSSSDTTEIEPGSRGMVCISTRYFPEERRVELAVKDDGVGIAASDLKRIFVVFNSSKGNQGTGLGLSVSQKILHEHGGDIRVESERGEGSTFTLLLPAVLADSSSHEEPQADDEGDFEMTDHGSAAQDANS